MPLLLAVVDPLPMFRRGIAEALGRAGFEPEGATDLLAWVRQPPRRVVVLTLHSAKEWDLLAQLRIHSPEVVVVAMLVEDAIPNYIRAIVSGATTVLSRDAPILLVQRAFEEALEGRTMLPVDVVRELTASVGGRIDEDRPRPSERELDWLNRLADGMTVARLAKDAGYSERAMFRLLKDLYERIGARGRTEALMRAQQRGWLEPGPY